MAKSKNQIVKKDNLFLQDNYYKILATIISGVVILTCIVVGVYAVGYFNQKSNIDSFKSYLPLTTPTTTLTETPTYTPTPIPTQKPQVLSQIEQCLQDVKNKIPAFTEKAKAEGVPEWAIGQFIQTRIDACYGSSSSYKSDSTSDLERRLDKIEFEQQQRKTWDLICGEKGYNSMIGACN